MTDLIRYADVSSSTRAAIRLAEGISTNLSAIRNGPVFEHERDKLVGQVDAWFVGLADYLGYKVEKRA